MATYNSTHDYPAISGYPENPDARQWLAHQLGRLSAWAERRRLYHSTVAELMMLSERELADIGIGRGQIREIALDAARAGQR